MKPVLSVAMIVKDEEAVLPRCLASLGALGGLLAKVSVYDTGSTDATVQVARDFGADVVCGEWVGDFSEARNHSLEGLTTPWILSVDADEQVVCPDAGLLATVLAQIEEGGGNAAHIEQVNFDELGEPIPSAYQTRLFRSGTFRYANAVHEVLRPLAGHELSPVVMPSAALCLHHDGYADTARVERKLQRNLDAAHAQLDAAGDDLSDPNVLKAAVDRARSYVGVGRHHDALWDLLRVQAVGVSSPYRTYGLEQLGDLLITLGFAEEAIEAIDEAEREGGAASTARFLRARRLAALGRPEEALELLRGLDHIASTVGITQAPGKVLTERAQLAEGLGHWDEAVSCRLTLILGLDLVDSQVPALVRLWEGRDPGQLAGLLSDARGASRDRLVAALERQGEAGRQVAGLLAQQRSRRG